MNQQETNEALTSCLQQLPEKFARTRDSLMPVLQHVQGEVGYLPPDAMMGIARFLQVPEATVYGAATFYSQFRFEPKGKFQIVVCEGTACHVRGCGGILRDLGGMLDVAPGRTTKDQLFTLETVACFGSCALAPVMLVNDKVHGRMSPASARKLIEDLRKQELADAGAADGTDGAETAVSGQAGGAA